MFLVWSCFPSSSSRCDCFFISNLMTSSILIQRLEEIHDNIGQGREVQGQSWRDHEAAIWKRVGVQSYRFTKAAFPPLGLYFYVVNISMSTGCFSWTSMIAFFCANDKKTPHLLVKKLQKILLPVAWKGKQGPCFCFNLASCIFGMQEMHIYLWPWLAHGQKYEWWDFLSFIFSHLR